MARRKMKVYLPRWTRWALLPFFALMWIVVTWGILSGGEPREREEVMGWLVATIVLVFVAGLIWAMSSGRLPAYEIEIDEDEGSP